MVTTDMIPGVVGLVGGETATDQTRTGWGGGQGQEGLLATPPWGGVMTQARLPPTRPQPWKSHLHTTPLLTACLHSRPGPGGRILISQ